MPALAELIAVPPLAVSAVATPPHEAVADWLVVPVFDEEFPPVTASLDDKLGGALTRLRESGDLGTGPAETLVLPDVPALAASRLLVVGLGDPARLTRGRLAKAVRTATRIVSAKNDKADVDRVAFVMPATDGGPRAPAEIAETIAAEVAIARVGQGLYQRESKRVAFGTLELLVATADDLSEHVTAGVALGESVNLARGLVNAPADDVYPASYAEVCEAVAADVGLACTVLDERELEAERMGSMLAVARGSDRPPRLVKFEHRGGGDGPTLALVGKGVTFDSGGLSLKPSDGMKDMKCDMGGSAAVVGAMAAIARRKLPVNVVGYIGLVENMVSGNSYKLGDVLQTRQGTTVEVLNTDAEGRLVLADVLDYAVTTGCDAIVDLATLTGACMVALGEDVSGLFANDDDWSSRVQTAADAAGELVWPMPMHDHFAKLLDSDVADCKNVGPRWGGAVTAAKFLEKFVGDTPWVHLDIAGPAFAASSKPHREGGATGALVRTLVELASGYGE
ncbi:MAG: leucyl aminopeptidase [Planctomycetota bacterium]